MPLTTHEVFYDVPITPRKTSFTMQKSRAKPTFSTKERARPWRQDLAKTKQSQAAIAAYTKNDHGGAMTKSTAGSSGGGTDDESDVFDWPEDRKENEAKPEPPRAIVITTPINDIDAGKKSTITGSGGGIDIGTFDWRKEYNCFRKDRESQPKKSMLANRIHKETKEHRQKEEGLHIGKEVTVDGSIHNMAPRIRKAGIQSPSRCSRSSRSPSRVKKSPERRRRRDIKKIEDKENDSDSSLKEFDSGLDLSALFCSCMLWCADGTIDSVEQYMEVEEEMQIIADDLGWFASLW